MFEIPMGRIIRRNSFLARGEEAEDVRIVNTEGSYVFDPNRKKYIDFMMGWCVGNLGWDQREINYATEPQERAREEGLLFSIEETRLLLLPALNVDQEAAKDGLDILERCA